MEKMKKSSRNIKLWPILYVIGCDLLFFWVINVTFLTNVKGLSYEQFFMLDLIAAGVDMLTTVPILYLIARIGNNASIKVALLMFVASSVLFTFGDSFALFAIANVLYFKAYQFFIVYPIILENNLEKYGAKNDFIKYNARGKLGYAILTLLIAFCAGFLYDANAYLPMYMCIGFTVSAFIMSFFVRDETGGRYNATKVLSKSDQKLDKSLVVFAFVLFAFVLIFKGCWYIGNHYAKISLQEIGIIMQALTIVIFVARGVRVFVDFFIEKIINKFSRSLAVVLPVLLIVGLALLSIPLIVIQDFVTKLILISLGIVIIFAIYDLFKLYIYDIIVKKFPKDTHLKMFWLNTLFDTVGIFVANIIITCAVANLSVGFALLTIVATSVIALILGVIMYSKWFKKEISATDDEIL